MRNLIYSINLTIDGCGDHTKIDPDEEILDFYTKLIQNSDLLLYGRITYQLMVPYWPDIANNPAGETKADVEFAKVFSATDKIVFSQSLEKVEDKNSRILRSKPEEEIPKLKQEPGKNILLGGLALASHIIKLGLVDEYYFIVHPTIAGEGRRLFEGISLQERSKLKLVDTRIFKPGGVLLHYLKNDQD